MWGPEAWGGEGVKEEGALDVDRQAHMSSKIRTENLTM